MNADGYRTSSWITKSGKTRGGAKYSLSRVTYMLKNQAYIGNGYYKGQIYPGTWPSLIDKDTWDKVHAKLESHRKERKAYRNTGCSGILAKVLKCKKCGSAIVHTYVLKEKRRKYRYYYCSNAQKRGHTECAIRYVNAPALEECVEQILRGAINNNKDLQNSSEAQALLSPLWNTLFFEEKLRIIRALIQEATFDMRTNKISIVLTGSPERLEFDSNVKKVHAPTRDGKERRLAKEPPIRKLLLLAHQLEQHLSQGTIKDLNQASTWTGINQSRLSHILTLLNLSPSIQTEILTSPLETLPNIPEYKLRNISEEIDWDKQANFWQELKQNLT